MTSTSYDLTSYDIDDVILTLTIIVDDIGYRHFGRQFYRQKYMDSLAVRNILNWIEILQETVV